MRSDIISRKRFVIQQKIRGANELGGGARNKFFITPPKNALSLFE